MRLECAQLFKAMDNRKAKCARCHAQVYCILLRSPCYSLLCWGAGGGRAAGNAGQLSAVSAAAVPGPWEPIARTIAPMDGVESWTSDNLYENLY
jgi:hypothetical protein